MEIHKIAQKKFTKTVGNINQEEYPQEFRNAFYLPLYFYLENSVEEATQKILSGACKDNYIMPEQSVQKELVKSIKDKIVRALQTDMSGFDAKIHGDYDENMAWNIIEEFC